MNTNKNNNRNTPPNSGGNPGGNPNPNSGGTPAGKSGNIPRNPSDTHDQHDDITADRLIEAANAAYKAAVEIAETNGGPRPYPPDLMGSPMQPRILCDFTRAEIQEATDFLVRLGMLDAPKAKGRK